MARSAWWVWAGILALAGCGAGVDPGAAVDAAGPRAEAVRTTLPAAGASGITVMTRNLYVGTDVSKLLGASSVAVLPGLVGQGLADVAASDPAGRMEKIADEIIATHPDLVGLQECELVRTRLATQPAPATTVAYDFLQLLLNALHARGVDYVPVVVGNETDVELPALTPNGLIFARLTDRDILLARAVGVSTANPEAHHFTTNLTVSIPGTGSTITVSRGWVEVDATVNGRTVHVADTHLEAFSDALRFVQATELAQALAAPSHPELLLGDLNADPGTLSYDQLLSVGFVDLWTEANPRDPGYTCCNADALDNEFPTYVERIDDILLQLPSTANQDFVGGVQAIVVGDQLSDKTDSGLWPSDHAGTVATIRLPRGRRFADR